MIRRFRIGVLEDVVWGRTLSVVMGLFLVFFSDAVLSYWVPNFLEESLGGSLLMGLVMAFSSVVGLGADLIFPEIFKGTGVRRMMAMAIGSSLVFSGVLLVATILGVGGVTWPLVVVALVAMGVWGIYYELMGFADRQFVAESVPREKRTSVWAVLGMFKGLAYFLGPLLAGFLIEKGNSQLLVVTGSLTMVGYGVFRCLKLGEEPVKVDKEEISLVKEISHWRVLLVHVWPVVIVSLMLGLVDATFWTVGTIWSETLAKNSWWGGWFLSAYMLPSLFMGFVVVKWGIYEHKKKWSEIFMLVAGIMLAGLGVSEAIAWQLIMVVLMSMMLAVTYPLTDAVYSDIVARMGKERKHLIGLSNSTLSMAYIVGPILAGGLAEWMGERQTFVVMGLVMVVVASVLLLVTPKKLKLPQQEIETWGKQHKHG